MADPCVSINRGHFPKGFVFGSAGSAFQYEGAVNIDGKGPSIWDKFAHTLGHVPDGHNGIEAIDHYHRFKEDVAIIKGMGLDAYRFSIAWSRVIPSGKRNGGKGDNPKGIEFYNNLINELLANGIEPYVTMLHFEPPLGLEKEYGGFLDRQIVDDFRDYADLCFSKFGDRVKNWITINEPWGFSYGGYTLGTMAPGRGAKPEECEKALADHLLPATRESSEESVKDCKFQRLGDPGTEPYIASHHQILAHAAAVDLYRKKYQASQKGQIGITHVAIWMIPYSDSKSDKDAAERAFDFVFGKFVEPLVTGDYPKVMRDIVQSRLPQFSEEESKLVKGSFDFLGLNYYTANYVKDAPNLKVGSYITDVKVKYEHKRDGVPIGEQAGSDWLFSYPRGIRDLLLYVKKKYNDPLIYITENGWDELNIPSLPLSEALNDDRRIAYHYHHLQYLKEAIDKGANVTVYFAWSLMDNYEWTNGYTKRFGINFIDYKDDKKRYSKSSADWFRRFLQKGSVTAGHK